MVEGEGHDEERTVAGHVHLERYVPLVQTNCLAFLGQRRLQQFSTDLLDGRKMLKWVRDIGWGGGGCVWGGECELDNPESQERCFCTDLSFLIDAASRSPGRSKRSLRSILPLSVSSRSF